jgi:hypothetical protein
MEGAQPVGEKILHSGEKFLQLGGEWKIDGRARYLVDLECGFFCG